MKTKLHELNPNVSVDVADVVIDESLDASFIHQFDVVLLHGHSHSVALHIDSLCRSKSTSPMQFFWSDSFGQQAVFVSDFGEKFLYRKDASIAHNNSVAHIGSAAASQSTSAGSFLLLFFSLSDSLKRY